MSQTTIRQQIVDELKLRLAKISTDTSPLADGFEYQTDIGKNDVEEWVTNYNQEELQDAEGDARLAIFDLVEEREKENRDSIRVMAKLPVQVRIFHKQGTTPAALRVMIADVMRAVVTNRTTGAEDIQMNKLAVDTSPDDNGFIVPKDSFEIDGAAVGFTVYYTPRPFQA